MSAIENINRWLEKFRALGKENASTIEVDFSEEELASIERAATSLGMTFDEYCNYALEKAFFSKFCSTCRQYRPERSNICNYCGEVD